MNGELTEFASSAAGKILRRELRDLAAKDTKKPSAKL